MTHSTHTPSRARCRLAGILLAFTVSLVGVSSASAASTSTTTTTAPLTTDATSAAAKIAVDLRTVIAASATPIYSSWVRDINGVRHVKAIVVATPSADPELASLRKSVLAVGGSVYFRYTSVTALSVLLPAQRVIDIAMLADVQGVSPNRMTARTAAGYSGLDGSGVGIAILDSGVMLKHQLFSDAAGVSRVR